MRDPTNGRSRGFAFLTFADPMVVNKVMVKEHFLDGKLVRGLDIFLIFIVKSPPKTKISESVWQQKKTQLRPWQIMPVAAKYSGTLMICMASFVHSRLILKEPYREAVVQVHQQESLAFRWPTGVRLIISLGQRHRLL
jgi:hypothetical protein